MHFLAFDFGAVTDAIDIEHAAKSLAHSLSHVGDQFARQPVQCADLAVILLALDAHHIAVNFDLNAGRESPLAVFPWVLRDERRWRSTATLTPAGIVTGNFPMRDT